MKEISKNEKFLIIAVGVLGAIFLGFISTHIAMVFTGFICGVGSGTVTCLFLRVLKK